MSDSNLIQKKVQCQLLRFGMPLFLSLGLENFTEFGENKMKFRNIYTKR